MRERYAYVMLALISVVIGVGSFLYTGYQVNQSQQKWCKLVNTSLDQAKNIQKPADPKDHPAQEKLYENYIIVHNLGRSLGCL